MENLTIAGVIDGIPKLAENIKKRGKISIKKQFIIIACSLSFFIGCGSKIGFNDKTPGVVDPKLHIYVNSVANLSMEYGAELFYERMQYVDVTWSDSEQGQALLNGEPMAEAGLTFPVGTERVIVINSDNFNDYATDTERLIIILHEFRHAVADEISNQHIEDVVYTVDSPEPITEYTQPLMMPLSLMSSKNCLLAAYFWDKYQDFYLRTFFGLRLDKTWK